MGYVLNYLDSQNSSPEINPLMHEVSWHWFGIKWLVCENDFAKNVSTEPYASGSYLESYGGDSQRVSSRGDRILVGSLVAMGHTNPGSEGVDHWSISIFKRGG